MKVRDILQEIRLKEGQIQVLDNLVEYLRLFLPPDTMVAKGDKAGQICLEDCMIPDSVDSEAVSVVRRLLVNMMNDLHDEVEALGNTEGDSDGRERKAGRGRQTKAQPQRKTAKKARPGAKKKKICLPRRKKSDAPQ